MALSKKTGTRRSPCPVSCTLDLLGDRWTLLIVRDLYFAKSRFKDFLSSPEGIPTNILTDRLNRLVENEVLVKVSAGENSKHLAYQLTEKGLALMPILQAMREWGLQWEPGTVAAMEKRA